VIILLLVGFAAGFATAISPCVLPVLPILLAGGATGGKRRPYAIVSGLVVSFVVFTLGGAWLLDQLGLPKDFLRNLAIALLFVVAATLLFPRFGDLLARPFYRLTRRPSTDLGGGFLLGASLGLVFVPCAGPVLAVISVLAATEEVGGRLIVLTVSYAVGAAVPMLAIALGGRAGAGMRALRPHAQAVRRGLGVVVALTALAIAFNIDRHFQTAVPDYTKKLQSWFEENSSASRELDRLQGGERRAASDTPEGTTLPDLGAAQDFAGISQWLNTPGEEALSLRGLRGKVVLVDFWTYSCINCLRTLPHLKAWDRAYRLDGLAIVGVHTPEFAFEQEEDNVRGAVERLGVRYPVAMDNDFETWDAFQNRYWPAKYLIDARGHLRYVHFGEGSYGETESRIRELLAEQRQRLPAPVRVGDPTPKELYSPETYLGAQRLNPSQFVGEGIAPGIESGYSPPDGPLALNELAYGGRLTIEPQRIVTGPGARVFFHFRAKDVHLVLGGLGAVQVLVDGKPRRTVTVSGDRLYTLLRQRKVTDAQLELRFTPGVSAYAFTFG
jgi:cytochrome c biogenesis protein CcdA/thiol-disulfide isomerase/thioredoxin